MPEGVAVGVDVAMDFAIGDRPLRLRPGAPACGPTMRDIGAELALAAWVSRR
jgi:hypothetical protein